MKNPVEVLQIKELELTKLKKEVDALRVAIQLLTEEPENGNSTNGGLRTVVEMP
ncbi:MAG TPA: hypothetical protein VLW84_00825 [Terriglobales bacterium]|nr:hypothetical protein [Terriglobales bacterium]